MYHGTNTKTSRRDDRLRIHPLCAAKKGEGASAYVLRGPPGGDSAEGVRGTAR